MEMEEREQDKRSGLRAKASFFPTSQQAYRQMWHEWGAAGITVAWAGGAEPLGFGVILVGAGRWVEADMWGCRQMCWGREGQLLMVAAMPRLNISRDSVGPRR